MSDLNFLSEAIRNWKYSCGDTLTRKTQFVAEFSTFRQASSGLIHEFRLDYEQVLNTSGGVGEWLKSPVFVP